MRFCLVYSGPLSASGNSKKKPDQILEIRKRISSQLEFLWKNSAALKRLQKTAVVAKEGSGYWSTADSPNAPIRDFESRPVQHDEEDLCARLQHKSVNFLPLVRESLNLNCELDILFLRQEDPGSLFLQGGDLDNRIKTLLDALRMPSGNEAPCADEDKTKLSYTLMESDTLISSLNIKTDRLLFPQTEKPDEVHLVIYVQLRVLSIGPWNICLV